MLIITAASLHEWRRVSLNDKKQKVKPQSHIPPLATALEVGQGLRRNRGFLMEKFGEKNPDVKV